MTDKHQRLPHWLKRPLPTGQKFARVLNTLKELKLSTVCHSARCPNQGECYSCGTATFMIMGEVCTRNCQFCAVAHGDVKPLSADEPQRLAQAVDKLNLKHVVITSVTRDDLPDGGAAHFADVIETLQRQCPLVTVEVLTPDFQGNTDCLDIILAANCNVFNHNIETPRRLTKEIRKIADYDCSLSVLKYMADAQDGPIVKSGFMLGLGENSEDITEMLTDLKSAGVQMVTIGQYLRPTKDNIAVQKYYTPEEFKAIGDQARAMGFVKVESGPFVRSSYHAEEAMQK
ncbi:MAG: lipoyl synthase [Phycisphaerae bacterium]|nr:lipoyl synthase [Phycisphaerae bacterium]